MGKNLRIIMPFIFLCGFIAYKALTFSSFAGNVVNQCDPVYLKAKIENMLNQPYLYPDLHKLLVKARKEAQELEISQEERDQAFKTEALYIMLVQNRCDVPRVIEEQVIQDKKNLYGGEDTGIRICPKDTFLEAAEKEYMKISESQEALKILEQNVFRQITEGSERAYDYYQEKWKDAAFRKRMIISGFQTILREKNGCKDSSMPIDDELESIFRDIALGGK